MKSYRSLNYLKNNNINFKYTPFDQGALVNILDETWLGACNAIAHEWMYRKICAHDMNEQIAYEITEPHLPHPVIFGNNTKESEEISRIDRSLSLNYSKSKKSQYSIDFARKSEKDKDNLENSIEKLINFIESKNFHYGIITSSILILEETPDLPQSFGHAISFVKRGNKISWFDPNYGEITFSKFSDFKKWFKHEVEHGVLNFFINNRNTENNSLSIADIFPEPKFTEEQISTNTLSKKITERRIQAHRKREEITNFIIADYEISSYSGNKYINPEEIKSEKTTPYKKNTDKQYFGSDRLCVKFLNIVIDIVNNHTYWETQGKTWWGSKTPNGIEMIRKILNKDITPQEKMASLRKVSKERIDKPDKDRSEITTLLYDALSNSEEYKLEKVKNAILVTARKTPSQKR